MIRKIAVIFAIALFTSNAYANLTVSSTAPTGLQGFNPSNNVKVGVETGASNSTYQIASKHKQGDKIYGTTSAVSYIYMKAGQAGTDLADADGPHLPDAPSDTEIGSTWTQM